jgi:uncharacterized protein (DUF58 family)
VAGGTEVTGYSDYSAGDDFRYVDWNRCARSDELVSKRFQGNEDQHVYLLIDGSASMQLGSPSKFAAAARLAAALGYLALANHSSLSATLFSDRTLVQSPPFRGRKQTPHWLQLMSGLHCDAAASNLRSACRALIRRGWPRGLVVVISDLFDAAGFKPAIDVLRRYGYQPHLVQVYSRCDAEPDLHGKFALYDVQSGRTHRVFLDQQDLANYRAVFHEFCQSVRGYGSHYAINVTQTRSDESFEQCIRKMMLKGVK